MPKGDIVEYIVVIDVKGFTNDKGITSGYDDRTNNMDMGMTHIRDGHG